ncbi:MAG TPA: glycogen debranching enzyme N-terminal domain-containing protein, partial [Cytophagaceae bacterium]
MKIELLGEITKDYNKATSREWLETNGLGGWASGTISGANTRSYHGLFVVATHPPVGRMVLLSKLEENIIANNTLHQLSSNQFPNKICDDGLHNLTSFSKEFFPSFQYNIGGIEIKKQIASVHNENTVAITYEVTKADTDFTMELKPFVAYRDYHSLGKVNPNISNEAFFGNGLLHVKPYPEHPPLYIYAKDSSFRYKPEWCLNFEYSNELERGLNFQEDLFTHGSFIIPMKKGTKISIVIAISDPTEKDAFKLIKSEKQRREQLLSKLPTKDDLAKALTLAADQFLVKRDGDLRTIIAGYHWFSDWGRDTMISLPGLCLVTGRYEEAKKILKAFCKSIDRGMIPNRFPDVGEEPEYNTVDATLW